MLKKTLHGIKTRHLEALRAVIEFGSTRAAAQKLGVTQPAVSQLIKQLEGLTRTELFTRQNYRLVATEAAQNLYWATDQLFHEINRVNDLVSQALGEEQVVSISVPHILGLGLVPRMIARLTTDEPDYRFAICTENYGGVVEHVLTGRSEFGVARLPLDAHLMAWAPLCLAHSVCLLHPQHRLASKETIDINDLDGERMISLDRRYASPYMGLNTPLYGMIESNISIEFDSIGHEAAFVAEGNGLAITNSFIASQCSMFDVTVRRFHPSAVYEFVVFWRASHRLSPPAEAAMRMILAMAAGA